MTSVIAKIECAGGRHGVVSEGLGNYRDYL